MPVIWLSWINHSLLHKCKFKRRENWDTWSPCLIWLCLADIHGAPSFPPTHGMHHSNWTNLKLSNSDIKICILTVKWLSIKNYIQTGTKLEIVPKENSVLCRSQHSHKWSCFKCLGLKLKRYLQLHFEWKSNFENVIKANSKWLVLPCSIRIEHQKCINQIECNSLNFIRNITAILHNKYLLDVACQ